MYFSYPDLVISSDINENFLKYVKENGTTVLEGDVAQVHDAEGALVSPANEAYEAVYEKIRNYLYRTITDPMYMKHARGEISKDEWIEAVNKIKSDWATPSP